jgi:hypothetical protein
MVENQRGATSSLVGRGQVITLLPLTRNHRCHSLKSLNLFKLLFVYLKYLNLTFLIISNLITSSRKYLCIPMSSAPSERAFSNSGQIITSQRCSLDPETACKLSYVQQNWGRVDVRTWNYVDPPSPEAEVEEGPQEPQPGPSSGRSFRRALSFRATPAVVSKSPSSASTERHADSDSD